jgi:50S ribosomal protein L16 3-hydroxylase
VVEALNAIRMNDPDKLGDWFGRFITTYRAAGEVVAGADPLPREEIEAALSAGLDLQRHPWARVAWRRAKRGASLYCSGLEFALPVKDAQVLAATEQLGGAVYGKLSAKGRDAVQALMAGGYYQLFDPNARDEAFDDEAFDDEADADDGHVAGNAVVDGTDSIEVMHDATVEADVHEVTIHEDGIEVIVDFDDSDDQDDGRPA